MPATPGPRGSGRGALDARGGPSFDKAALGGTPWALPPGSRAAFEELTSRQAALLMRGGPGALSGSGAVGTTAGGALEGVAVHGGPMPPVSVGLGRVEARVASRRLGLLGLAAPRTLG